MRTIAAAIVTVAVLAGPAYSQISNDDSSKDPWQMKLEADRKARESADKEYNNAMKRIKSQAPTTAVSNDPWRGVRPAAKSDAAEAKRDAAEAKRDATEAKR